MRLIDADALVKQWTVNGDYENCIYDGAFVVKSIENAPAFEAIPIEWIEEWYKKKGSKPFVADDVSVRLLLRDWREQ